MSSDDPADQKASAMCPQCGDRIGDTTLADHLHYCEAARAAAQAELTDSFGGARDA
jgi:hypothetical protein